MRVLCYYGGSGSMAYAAKKLGHTIVGNIEPRNFERGETFRHNFKEAFFSKRLSVMLDSLSKIDIMLGHPSCGAFSSFNIFTRKHADEVVNFFNGVKLIKPEFFICDNLEKSCLHIKPVLSELTNEYNIYPQFIQNKYYGNPQNRKRVYIIGGKKKYKYVPTPNENKNNIVSVKDRIGHLLGKEGQVYGHFEMKRNNNWDRMLHVKQHGKPMTYAEGKEWWKNKTTKDLVKYINKDGIEKVRIGLKKIPWETNCNVLTGSTPKVHPIRNNCLTVKESLLLMGYEDDFEIPGIVTDQNNEVDFIVNYYRKIRKGVCIESIKHFIKDIQICFDNGKTLKEHETWFTGKEYENSEFVNLLKLLLCKKQGKINCTHCQLKNICKEF